MADDPQLSHSIAQVQSRHLFTHTHLCTYCLTRKKLDPHFKLISSLEKWRVQKKVILYFYPDSRYSVLTFKTIISHSFLCSIFAALKNTKWLFNRKGRECIHFYRTWYFKSLKNLIAVCTMHVCFYFSLRYTVTLQQRYLQKSWQQCRHFIQS